MDIANDIWLGEAQQVVVALEVAVELPETVAAIILFCQAIPLDHGAHAAIQEQNALLQDFMKALNALMAVGHGVNNLYLCQSHLRQNQLQKAGFWWGGNLA